MEFKDTMMGKMTMDACKAWGIDMPVYDENGEPVLDENGNQKTTWVEGTEESVELLVGEGLPIPNAKKGVVLKYSNGKEASDNKTYGSEIAGLEMLTALILKSEMNPEELQELIGENDPSNVPLTTLLKVFKESKQDQFKELLDDMLKQVYEQDKFNPEITDRIRKAVELNGGPEKTTLEVLEGIHDNWVRTNGPKFIDRPKKKYQFVDLRLMRYDEDGVLADYKFFGPVMEGAGYEIDPDPVTKDGADKKEPSALREEFMRRSREYQESHRIKGYNDKIGLRRYIEHLGENYPPAAESYTVKKQPDSKKVAEIMTTEDVNMMVEQVSDNMKANVPEVDERVITSEEIGEMAMQKNVSQSYSTATIVDEQKKGKGEVKKDPEEKQVDEHTDDKKDDGRRTEEDGIK